MQRQNDYENQSNNNRQSYYENQPSNNRQSYYENGSGDNRYPQETNYSRDYSRQGYPSEYRDNRSPGSSFNQGSNQDSNYSNSQQNRDYQSGLDSNRPYERSFQNYRSGYPSGSNQTSWSDQNRENQNSNRGKGPKNWKRSDDKIMDEVCDRLEDSDELDASNINVDVKDCVVTLKGSVESRSAKRRVEDLIENCRGVQDVNNSLTLDKGQKSRSQSTSSKK